MKTPKHGRWHNGKIVSFFFMNYDRKACDFSAVVDDVSKKVIKRVPSSLIRQLSDDGAKDVEIHGGDRNSFGYEKKVRNWKRRD